MPEVSWLFFQGANEDPYLTDTGRESNAEKQPTGSGPEGCDENGPTAMRCRRSVLALHSREEAKRGRFAYVALPAAHFNRNKVPLISGTGH